MVLAVFLRAQLNLQLHVVNSVELQGGTSSPTGKHPNMAGGSDDAAGSSPCDVKPVTSRRGFRPWRQPVLPVRVVLAAARLTARSRRSGLGSRPLRIVHAPKTAAQRAKEQRVVREQPGLHVHRSDQTWASSVPYLEIYVTQESL